MTPIYQSLSRLTALAIGIVACCLWWQAYGLPKYVYLLFDIGRRSPLPDRFVGFLSIVAMGIIAVSCMLLALGCFIYFFKPSIFNEDGKKAAQPVEFLPAHRCAGLGVFAAGLVIVFLAFQVPENTLDWLYDAGFRRGMRELIGVPIILLAIIVGMCGTFLAFAGGGMALCPAKFSKSK